MMMEGTMKTDSAHATDTTLIEADHLGRIREMFSRAHPPFTIFDTVPEVSSRQKYNTIFRLF
jgi:hypothetical protein